MSSSHTDKAKGHTTQSVLGMRRPLVMGLLCYSLTSLIPLLGVELGHDFFVRPQNSSDRPEPLLDSFAAWDGDWFMRIVNEGYSYDPQAQSSVAFFPAYPLIAKAIVRVSGVQPVVALLIVSHVALAASFVVLAAYAGRRFPQSPPSLSAYVLLALGLLPTTFFFRMAYSESLFVLLTLVALYGLQQEWPPLVVALTVGLATATRAVGIALLLPFAAALWQRPSSWQGFAIRLTFLMPVACWGIAAYMVFQYVVFNEPLAFAKTQSHWLARPPVPTDQKLMALLAGEPIWSVYQPSSPTFWESRDNETVNHNPLFSLRAANPVFFLLSVILTGIGIYRGWLSRAEVSLSILLLLIPYLGRSFEMGMDGAARFASASFPVYLVLGHCLCRLPVLVSTLLLALSAFLLGVYAALFASWHPFT